jgi:hypothetical protein
MKPFPADATVKPPYAGLETVATRRYKTRRLSRRVWEASVVKESLESTCLARSLRSSVQASHEAQRRTLLLYEQRRG